MTRLNHTHHNGSYDLMNFAETGTEFRAWGVCKIMFSINRLMLAIKTRIRGNNTMNCIAYFLLFCMAAQKGDTTSTLHTCSTCNIHLQIQKLVTMYNHTYALQHIR